MHAPSSLICLVSIPAKLYFITYILLLILSILVFSFNTLYANVVSHCPFFIERYWTYSSLQQIMVTCRRRNYHSVLFTCKKVSCSSRLLVLELDDDFDFIKDIFESNCIVFRFPTINVRLARKGSRLRYF